MSFSFLTAAKTTEKQPAASVDEVVAAEKAPIEPIPEKPKPTRGGRSTKRVEITVVTSPVKPRGRRGI